MEKIKLKELKSGNYVILINNRNELFDLRKKGITAKPSIFDYEAVNINSPEEYPLIVIPISETYYKWNKMEMLSKQPRKIIRIEHIEDVYFLNRFQYEAFCKMLALGGNILEMSENGQKEKCLMQKCIELDDVNDFKSMSFLNISEILDNCIVSKYL